MGSSPSNTDQEPMDTGQTNGDCFNNGPQKDHRGHRNDNWERFEPEKGTPYVNRDGKPVRGNLIKGQPGAHENLGNGQNYQDEGDRIQYDERRYQMGPPTGRPDEPHQNGLWTGNQNAHDQGNWQTRHAHQEPRTDPRYDDRGHHMDRDTTRRYPDKYTDEEHWRNKHGHGDTSPRKHNGNGYDAAWEQQRGEEKYYREQQRQQQQQLQQQRSAEGMLFSVDDNFRYTRAYYRFDY